MWSDLLVNLLAALIAFSVGWLSRGAARVYGIRRPAAKVWRLPHRSAVSIVVADVQHNGEGPRNVAAMHPAEFAAATEISAFLSKQFGCAVDAVCTSAQFQADSLGGNLIVIGGPIHNAVFRQLDERMKIPYRFEGRTLAVPSRGVVYSPTLDQNGNLTADVGLVVVARNPVEGSSRVILLAGCRTFACLGAARMLVVPR